MQEFVGQKVLLTTGRAVKVDGENGNTRSMPKRTTIKFTITDVAFTGVYEIDRHYVYLPIEVLSKKLYPDKDPVADTIQIRLATGVTQDSGKDTVNRLWREWSSKINHSGIVEVTTSQELQADILAESDLGKQVLALRSEKDNLLDTVWLATSCAQIKELWEQVNALLELKPTALEEKALQIEPVEAE